MNQRRRGIGLGTRILAALIVVLCVAAVTAWIVALIIGPLIFHDHMLMVEGANPEPEVITHAEEAFDAAWKLTLAFALLAALGTSVIVTLFLVRRLISPISTVRGAVTKVADGDYTARVPEVSMGAEFTELMDAFNAMASKLDQTEGTRKRLLSDLAHEMRTPVATVDGYLEAMQDGVAYADEETLVMLREQTARLTRLAEDISLVSAAEERNLSLQPAPVQVGELLAAAEAQTRGRYLEKRVDLRVEAAAQSHDIVVTVDDGRIGQVLTNLLDNALHHTDPGDEVTLRAAHSATSVTIEVSDTGHGIAAEHLPHIFERFYRVDTARDRKHGGSGIGLSIVDSIITAHGGTVRARSDGPGTGAVFSIELPRHNPGETMKVR